MKSSPLIPCLLLSVLLLAMPGTAAAQTIEQFYQASLYVQRGDQYTSMNLWDKAEEEYWKAVELDYNNIRARKGLGDVYRQKGMFTKAVENYQIMLNQRPDDVEIQYQIALSYYDNHEYQKAVAAAEKALNINPELSKADNLIRLSNDKYNDQQVENKLLLDKEKVALQNYRQVQELKEGAFIGKLVPGWRLIQTAETKSMWTGYTILGTTAAMLLGGYMLRSSGQKAYDQALEASSRKVYDNRVDLGERRYKYGGYMIDAALGLIVLNIMDSIMFKGKIFGGRTRVKPTIPERERNQTY
ncbi:MAG: tetratricopeptide repeat protein [Candidatus Glassbacteria bacterium]|nr:tetratricopeptide repeat protein [Candidatus Glassbacteria bacterium]